MTRATAENDYERYKMRLDAEVGLAASSAFFCGVSLDMLSEVDTDTQEWIVAARCISLAFVAASCVYCVIVQSFTYFTGLRVLGKSKKGHGTLNKNFTAFRDQFSTERRIARDLCVVAPAVFMVGSSVVLFDKVPHKIAVACVSIEIVAAVYSSSIAMRMLDAIVPGGYQIGRTMSE